MPSNYTNANTIAFISFDDVSAVINFDYDINGKIFKTGAIPAGINAVITVISKQAGNYFSKQTMISTLSSGASGGYQIVNLTPVITSLDEIKNKLRNL